MRFGRMAVVAALLAVPGLGSAEEQKTYRLTIGEVAVDIDPGETLDVTMPDGKQTKVTLQANEFATCTGNMFSYVHPAGVAITKTELDKTINQYLMASALGTMVIVQEYASINPVSLNQLMLQEVTKESVQAGAELTQQPTTRKLADGRELTGLRATVKTRTDATDFEILSFGLVDQGLLMVTRISQENAASEGAIIDKFWESLTVKL
jgi:hypothetical protein